MIRFELDKGPPSVSTPVAWAIGYFALLLAALVYDNTGSILAAAAVWATCTAIATIRITTRTTRTTRTNRANRAK